MRFRQLSVLFIFLLTGAVHPVFSQTLSNARQVQLILNADTVTVDSLSIIPGSFYILKDGNVVDTSFYKIDFAGSKLTVTGDTLKMDTLIAVYRVFPLAFTTSYALRSVNDKKLPGKDNRKLYLYSDEDPSRELFRIEGLNKSGSISRGITIGNNQDAVVNSTLNLQLAGKLSNNIEVAAAITDDNIPVQPEGNTQQLQEFDKVYIQLSNENNKLIAGDFDMGKPTGYFMNFYKKGQGGWFSNLSKLEVTKGSFADIKTTVSGAVSRGKFARNVFNGIESNQGPYRLTGAENETFIVVLSGSEKIYIDGRLLKRGQSNDYIIDYNTAEITFTPQRLITKDSRIVVEFQYSDRNYSRTLFYGGSEAVMGKSKAYINIYSEQDAKNQPLQQDLSLDQKKLLSEIGDNINGALTLNADSVAFNPNEILYLKKDSIVNGVTYTNIYVWSVNPDSAFYRLGFSLVGANKGNYIYNVTSANGKVFQWVAPVNGIPQGNYEPVVLLITPKKRQMATAGYSFIDKNKTEFNFELAASKDDINTFSKSDKGNDDGWAAVSSFSKTIPISKVKPVPWTVVTSGRYEFTYRYFKQIEVFRAVEFSRDWNTLALTDASDEHNAAAGISLRQGTMQNIGYTLKTYIKPGSYNGLMHVVNTSNIYKSFALRTDGSYLSTKGDLIKSVFYRHKEDFSKQWKYVKTGIRFEEEHNEIQTGKSDSLALNSFAFRDAGIYIETPDTSRFKSSVSYNRRTDEAPFRETLATSALSDNITATAGYLFNRSNKIAVSVKYRKLEIKDTLLTIQKPDESLLSRVDHQLTVGKGFITATTYYEAGSGREQKRDFSYIAVAPGTGNFAWVDYNADGIPQLNEFEIPQFQDQATYIRIFTPSNEFIKVYTNQLNFVLNIQPAALQKKFFWNKLAILTAWRFDNKVTGATPEEGLNPFLPVYDNTSVITTNAGSRNTLFINKTGEITGTDISYNDQQSRQLLSNGIETRREEEWQLNNRVNFNSSFSAFTDLTKQEKSNTSEAFSTRNFNLDIYKAGEKLTYQPGSIWRVSLLYNITDKKNTIGDAGEKSLSQKGGVEFRYSSLKRGLLTLGFNMVYIDFNQQENTPLAYEMLEGLKKGVNYTWSASLQRNISSSFQLSINYEGRKPEGIKTIHTGGIQARAFF